MSALNLMWTGRWKVLLRGQEVFAMADEEGGRKLAMFCGETEWERIFNARVAVLSVNAVSGLMSSLQELLVVARTTGVNLGINPSEIPMVNRAEERVRNVANAIAAAEACLEVLHGK